MKLDALQAKNTHILIQSINSTSFLQYGRILSSFPADSLTAYMMRSTEIPSEGNIYVPALQDMMITDCVEKINLAFGYQPFQIGYCNGQNTKLNSLEYHKCCEINIAVTDMVLMLGKVQDIKGLRYNSNLLEIFYIPLGTVIELYSSTLHFSPCKVKQSGFMCVVILSAETNLPFDAAQSAAARSVEPSDDSFESRLLFARNKWLLSHKEHSSFIERGAYQGIDGPNITLSYLE